MGEKSKNRFTLKIMLSYLVLCALGLISGYFIYSEIQVFMTNDSAEETDVKLLKTGALVAKMYEAESLSKLALQNKTQLSFRAYALKIDSIYAEIDNLKKITEGEYQSSLLDSVKTLLAQKRANSGALLKLKLKNDANSSIDIALKEFQKMEASFGKLTIYDFEKNPDNLSPYEKKVLEDWVAYLNLNIPEDASEIPDSKKIDSILNAGKALLDKAKKDDAKTQRFLSQKEKEINKNDLELSQQLQTILSTFEQEIMVNTYNDNLKRQAAMRRSMRLAGITALLGFVIVGIFTFLINRDFWKVQVYRQKLEKEKKFSESLLKSREQLISTVSHDLRTPLNTISGYTELIESTDISEKQARYLTHVKSASEYVGNLVNDLLDFSKLEAGKLNIEKVPFVAANLIQETAENVATLYRNKNLKLHLEIDTFLRQTVLGDPFRLRQILTNLLGNAYKFTETGSITIKATTIDQSKKGATLKIEVIDTGIGIAKEKQHLIFKEFTQADRATEKKFGGYGLGLTISKKLAELLQGTLNMESKEDYGSTFTLRIPLAVSSKGLGTKKKIAQKVPKLSILIIDDDTSLLGMLGELTESMGIRAHTFSNFLAIKEDSRLSYDLVLTDIQMPQITGFEVLKKLQSGRHDHYQNQPIVAMTGRRDLDTDAYTSLGFAQVLQKPFSKDELIGMLNLIGIHIKQAEKKTQRIEKKKPVSNLYSLEIINSFLGENDEAVNDVLRTFLNDTNKNMAQLSGAVKAADYSQVNQVAHRMLPMFRQLKVDSTVSFLEKLELVDASEMNKGQLLDAFQTVKKGVEVLLAALEGRTTALSYSG